MKKRPRPSEGVYSRVSVKSQTVLPQQVREALSIGPGDTLRYRFTKDGVLIDKAPTEADDPFITFSEWAGSNDDEAYGEL